jgi:Fibronectin type III domain.
MNKLKNYIYLLGLSIAVILTGCSDQDDELTSIEYDRLFSPTEFEGKVINRTNVRLTWNDVKGAESYIIEVYNNGDLNFEGTPVKTISDISGTPYTIEGLDGETDYSIRIQALKSGKNSSKWTTVTAKTDTEQIFENIKDDDIEATQVTLHWAAGAEVTHILITPGDHRYNLSTSEIAAGTATISGLTGETAYKATLMNNDKIRGVLEFTTLVDLGGAIAVYPEDDFATLLAEAKDGDTFALFPGTYGNGAKLTVKASIGIKAVKPSDKPIIYANISIENGAALHLREIILDGTGAEANQALIFNTGDVTYGALLVEGCEIRNHDKGLYYLNVASIVESITIDNCIISNIVCNGGDFMDSRAGAIKTITLSNSTVYNSCAARDFIRYDDKASSFPGIAPVINVTNNTLVGVCNGAARRLLYVRFKGNVINFSNNIVTNMLGIFSNQSSTAVPNFNKNNYYEAPGLFSGGSETALFFDNSATSRNPQFQDAANGDFTVNNIDVSAGDPRWLK